MPALWALLGQPASPAKVREASPGSGEDDDERLGVSGLGVQGFRV